VPIHGSSSKTQVTTCPVPTTPVSGNDHVWAIQVSSRLMGSVYGDEKENCGGMAEEAVANPEASDRRRDQAEDHGWAKPMARRRVVREVNRVCGLGTFPYRFAPALETVRRIRVSRASRSAAGIWAECASLQLAISSPLARPLLSGTSHYFNSCCDSTRVSTWPFH
jgi:hypothetical protein